MGVQENFQYFGFDLGFFDDVSIFSELDLTLGFQEFDLGIFLEA